jgi:hypothetical protein
VARVVAVGGSVRRQGSGLGGGKGGRVAGRQRATSGQGGWVARVAVGRQKKAPPWRGGGWWWWVG